MRMIDADALIGPIKLLEESYRRCGAIERAEAYANCLWEIEQAPTVDGWISVKDMLPKKKGDYLIYNTDGIVWPYWYDPENKGWYDSCCYLTESVTHWMPLPEPPEEGELK